MYSAFRDPFTEPKRSKFILISTGAGCGPSSEHILPRQAKLRRGSQKVFVAAVDFLESVLPRAGQVQRVTGAEMNGRGQVLKGRAYRVEQRVIHRQPEPHAVGLILGEDLQDFRRWLRRELALAELPFDAGEELHAAPAAAVLVGVPLGQSAHLLGLWLVKVALQDVARVEVDHARSRSSDTAWAESRSVRGSRAIQASRWGNGWPDLSVTSSFFSTATGSP